MKWYNKDKTQMINLDRVDAWFYSPDCLTLFVYGAQITAGGEEAKELLSLLVNEKEVLHS
jgi:hypothetical protein